METEFQYMPEDVQQNKGMAFLAYLGILVLIPLLAKKDSPYAQFHAKQGLVLLLAWVAIGIVGAIPVIGWVVGPIGGIFLLVLFVMGVVNSLSGKAKDLPLIGQFAHKFNI